MSVSKRREKKGKEQSEEKTNLVRRRVPVKAPRVGHALVEDRSGLDVVDPPTSLVLKSPDVVTLQAGDVGELERKGRVSLINGAEEGTNAPSVSSSEAPLLRRPRSPTCPP